MPKCWIRIGTCYLRPDQFLDHLMVIKSVRAFPLLSYCHKSIWAVKTVRHIFACAWLHTNIFDCLHIFDSLFMLHWKQWNLSEQNWPLWERYNGGERPLKLVVVRDVFPSCGLCNNIIWAAVTWPCTISSPLCHTYSEPSGHEDSQGTTFYMPYWLKSLNKSRSRDLFLGYIGDF